MKLVMMLWVVAAGMVGMLVGGCAGGMGAQDDAEYVLVYLKTGPKADLSAEERQQVFRGHMANIHRLADEGKLVIAGPFDKPHDAAWRGILVMDVAKVSEAEQLAATDPGVQSGVFVTESRAMRASAELRRTMEFEREMLAAAEARGGGGEPAPLPGAGGGGPPPNIRGYVMITAADAGKVEKAIRKAGFGERVVWSGRFKDGGGGVYVVDSTSAADVQTLLEGTRVKTGEMWVDGWWSTRALERLGGSDGAK